MILTSQPKIKHTFYWGDCSSILIYERYLVEHFRIPIILLDYPAEG